MESLSKEVMEVLRDPESLKFLTTVSEEGVPHTVPKFSLTAIDENMLAYAELIERSTTYKNMLRTLWEKRDLSVCVFSPRTGASYEIIGEPGQYLCEGPIWKQFVDQIFSMMPGANPCAVWTIIPKGVKDERYEVRLEEERNRMVNYKKWKGYIGKR